jgi:hypothetical protein
VHSRSSKVRTMAFLAARDVPAASGWYQGLLGWRCTGTVWCSSSWLRITTRRCSAPGPCPRRCSASPRRCSARTLFRMARGRFRRAILPATWSCWQVPRRLLARDGASTKVCAAYSSVVADRRVRSVPDSSWDVGDQPWSPVAACADADLHRNLVAWQVPVLRCRAAYGRPSNNRRGTPRWHRPRASRSQRTPMQ